MKKLMIAAAIVCAAVMSQAAVANWKAGASEINDGTGTASLYSGTAYIFDAGVTGQSALYQMILDGDTIGSSTAGYMATATVSDGVFSNVNWTNGEQGDGKSYSYYFAIVEDGKAYFSQIKSGKPNSNTTPKSMAFGLQYDEEDPTAYPNSVKLPTATYEGEGRWVQTVPEPTSGLLLLLGVAGLALRRRRA